MHPAGRGDRKENFEAMVIANEAELQSVGANLVLVSWALSRGMGRIERAVRSRPTGYDGPINRTETVGGAPFASPWEAAARSLSLTAGPHSKLPPNSTVFLWRQASASSPLAAAVRTRFSGLKDPRKMFRDQL